MDFAAVTSAAGAAWPPSEPAAALLPLGSALTTASSAPALSYLHTPAAAVKHPYGVAQSHEGLPSSYPYAYHRHHESAASSSAYFHRYYGNSAPSVVPNPSPLLRYEWTSSVGVAGYDPYLVNEGSYLYPELTLPALEGGQGGIGEYHGPVPPELTLSVLGGGKGVRGEYHAPLPPAGEVLLAGNAGRISGFDPELYAQIVSARSNVIPSATMPASRNPSDGPLRRKNGAGKPTKKLKVIRSAYCEVCKIGCNTWEVLSSHKMGKRHKKNLEKLQDAITAKLKPVTTAKEASTQKPQEASTSAATREAIAPGDLPKNKPIPIIRATLEELEEKKRKVLLAGAPAEGVRVCTVCNIVVNNQKVYEQHIQGSKHAAMVQKLQEGAG